MGRGKKEIQRLYQSIPKEIKSEIEVQLVRR